MQTVSKHPKPRIITDIHILSNCKGIIGIYNFPTPQKRIKIQHGKHHLNYDIREYGKRNKIFLNFI